MCSLAVPAEACSKVSAIPYLVLAQCLQSTALLRPEPARQNSCRAGPLIVVPQKQVVLSGPVLQSQHRAPFVKQAMKRGPCTLAVQGVGRPAGRGRCARPAARR